MKAESPRSIVFSHANGFPAGTYRVLFEAWRAAGHPVQAVEKFGHDPLHPPTSNWPNLRNELIQLVERKCTQPAWLVGHSLGGYVSVLAAAKRPDLVRGVVLLDSPMLTGLLARALQIAKPLGLVKRFSPGRISKRRRQHWPSADAAFDHFAAKPLFARWQPGVLRDYIACGLHNTLPHHLGRLLRVHPLQCPMAFIGGTESEEVRRVGMRATQRLTHGQVSWIAGSHLFPFEKPAETAAEVLRWLTQFSATAKAD